VEKYVQLINLPKYSDERGELVVLERALPFEVKRVFWITGSNMTRGGHRHKETRMALCCLKGRSTVVLHDGTQSYEYQLSKNNEVLIIEPHEWHTMLNEDKETVLLVLASHYYKESDYVFEAYD
jgi:dTDP-4-dehydrorhamnose 3,5-epimerase-like enzyme